MQVLQMASEKGKSTTEELNTLSYKLSAVFRQCRNMRWEKEGDLMRGQEKSSSKGKDHWSHTEIGASHAK